VSGAVQQAGVASRLGGPRTAPVADSRPAANPISRVCAGYAGPASGGEGSIRLPAAAAESGNGTTRGAIRDKTLCGIAWHATRLDGDALGSARPPSGSAFRAAIHLRQSLAGCMNCRKRDMTEVQTSA
jgi:hypothetical protein